MQSELFTGIAINGGLFRPDVLEQDLDIKLKDEQWEEIFEFLNSYHWIIEDVRATEENEEKILTPEILGHVYERSVVEWESEGFEKEAENAVKKITERKKKGVYYTPESITDYISNNTIIPYLLDKLGNKYASFDELIKSKNKKDMKDAVKILDEIKVLDPACGSGAFLIKASEVIFGLKRRLQYEIKEKKNFYDLKLDIITENIYGVDILAGAIEISKLRLWLWLISDFEDSKNEIKALPNIEYNLKVGNSLVGWLDEKLVQMPMNTPLTEKVDGIFTGLIAFSENGDGEDLKKARELLRAYKLTDYIEAYYLLYKIYRRTHGLKAENLRSILETIRKSIYATVTPAFLDYVNAKIKPKYDKKNPPISQEEFSELQVFHWRIDFGHIILNGGFDVVIGNPPYVRVESIVHLQADLYKLLYESVYKRCDLYVAFIQKSFSLINNDGAVGIISSNQYICSEYGLMLRKTLLNKYGIKRIIDFAHYPVFPGISTYTAILIGSKRVRDLINCSIFSSEEAVNSIIQEGITYNSHKDIHSFQINKTDLKEEGWILKNKVELSLISKIQEKKEGMLSSKALIGSPLTTGKDEILYQEIDKEDSTFYYIRYNEKEIKLEKGIWKKIVRPRMLEKWSCDNPKIIVFFPYTKLGDKFELISENEFQSKFRKTYEFLLPFKESLLERVDSRKTWRQHGRKWFSLHRVGMPQNYDDVKILSQSVLNKPVYCLDKKGYLYPHGGVMGIVPINKTDPYFLIAYLNSKMCFYLLKLKAPFKRGGYISLDVGLLSDLPICDYNSQLSLFAQKIIDGKKDIDNNECKIDQLVYKLYDLTPEEIKIVEEFCEKK